MLNINLSEFTVELKDGAIRNVGPATKHAEAKLFDVTDAGAREFGDKRVKLEFADDDGNEVQVALFPEHARQVADEIAELADESSVFD